MKKNKPQIKKEIKEVEKSKENKIDQDNVKVDKIRQTMAEECGCKDFHDELQLLALVQYDTYQEENKFIKKK